MKLIYCIALLAVVFILAYNPNSRMIEKFMPGYGFQPRPVGPSNPPVSGMSLSGDNGSNCCSKTDYMANNPTQCEPAHYQGVQFADRDYGCPKRHPEAYMGAIIGR